jgi:hypothetical protein
MNKCPVCERSELQNSAWIPDDESEYESEEHYDCAYCGPMRKEHIDPIIKRFAEKDAEIAALRAQVPGRFGQNSDSPVPLAKTETTYGTDPVPIKNIEVLRSSFNESVTVKNKREIYFRFNCPNCQRGISGRIEQDLDDY